MAGEEPVIFSHSTLSSDQFNSVCIGSGNCMGHKRYYSYEDVADTSDQLAYI